MCRPDKDNKTDYSDGLGEWDSDARLEQALRDKVEEFFGGRPEELTVSDIRSSVEWTFEIEPGFFSFRDNGNWRQRSKDIIKEHAAYLLDCQDTEDEDNTGTSIFPASRLTQLQKLSQAPRTKTGKKRPATGKEGGEGPKKRLKKNEIADHSKGESLVKSPSSEAAPSAVSEKPTSTIDNQDGNAILGGKVSNNESHTTIDPEPESELSSVLDEGPKPKKKGAPKAPATAAGLKKNSHKTTKAQGASPDPDMEKIKRLQGWLVKCGIRKVWSKELAAFTTPKAKIKHLEEMLALAGMSGRYSQEKANRIREERELKADVEDVQAGNKQWGKAVAEEEDYGKPRRRLAKGLQELDFLEAEDGEDTE
ncbi:MAG: hypothetical protein Q9183_001372 [Haloplaca sp. 2 TL-2023]